MFPSRILQAVWVILAIACTQSTPAPPDPVLPIPSERQLAWHELEFYAFVHFNMNTFSNEEWGMGDESPHLFNPTELDCRQWARVCKEAGMKGIILTAKHHDGFCLWPSAYTEHSVKNSPWKDGKGDVVRELADACSEYGLKMGIYLSPWDRNHPDYGKPEYLTYFRNQLRELLTNYGEIFEVWFDGANGGTGYYGGANEERRVDKRNYYDWDNTYALIRDLQPNAVIFSDAGPDVRWVGNEHGKAYPTTWSPLLRDSVYGGMPEYATQYSMGQEQGTHWVHPESDVSIRPGWYYHPYEDHKVKSLPHLVDIYYESLGQNSSLLLNFPVDTRGLIHENDVARLQELTQKLNKDFAEDLAKGKSVIASENRGSGFEATNILDGNPNTYWAAPDGINSASLTLEFGQPLTFNRFLAKEYIALGQRVTGFTLEAQTPDGWQEIATGTTIGYQRILRFPAVTSPALRLNITHARACPTLSSLEVYHAPKLVLPPAITRDRMGMVSLTVPEEGVEIYYTLDGSTPHTNSSRYKEPFEFTGPGMVKAITADATQVSEVMEQRFDLAPANWIILEADPEADKVIDGDPNSWWQAKKQAQNQGTISLDLRERLTLTGFTYLPMQERWIKGFIQEYTFYTSRNGRRWRKVQSGEFGNILNSPILQEIQIKPRKAQYIRIEANRTVDGEAATFAEIGILTQ